MTRWGSITWPSAQENIILPYELYRIVSSMLQPGVAYSWDFILCIRSSVLPAQNSENIVIYKLIPECCYRNGGYINLNTCLI
jgi:hypothetical protein